VSFAKRPGRPPSRPRSPLSGSALLVRTFFLGAIAIAGAAWALARHYTHPMPPLRVPVAPSVVPTYEADAGEMPVPELLPPSQPPPDFRGEESTEAIGQPTGRKR
jgi:hypothetical protein